MLCVGPFFGSPVCRVDCVDLVTPARRSRKPHGGTAEYFSVAVSHLLEGRETRFPFLSRPPEAQGERLSDQSIRTDVRQADCEAT